MGIINSKHQNLRESQDEFFSAKPFPYLILDDFIDEDFFQKLQSVISNMEEPLGGKEFNTDVENKKWISLNSNLPNLIQQVVAELNSNKWIKNIQKLTEIESLLAVSGNAELANYHIMKPGSILGPHVDHSHESVKGTPHVLNIILYLTQDWDDNNGGGTLFYTKDGKDVVSRISYKANRAVLFLHTPYSFHGVEKINDDSKQNRQSIYVDYYSTSFDPYRKMILDFNNHWFKHGTTFRQSHYYKYLQPKNMHYAKTMLRYQFNKFRGKILSKYN